VASCAGSRQPPIAEPIVHQAERIARDQSLSVLFGKDQTTLSNLDPVVQRDSVRSTWARQEQRRPAPVSDGQRPIEPSSALTEFVWLEGDCAEYLLRESRLRQFVDGVPVQRPGVVPTGWRRASGQQDLALLNALCEV